ncbi:4Fe-4S binding protein [candidate division KSB1 bacterium]|nr:4Fe-4S binding protein [candidate division KSB1 bacterium]
MIAPKEGLCDFCGCCVAVCPTDAIELFESHIAIIHEKCIECQNCIEICPLTALEETDAEEL